VDRREAALSEGSSIMKRNLVWGFLTVNLLLGISAGNVAGKNAGICAGAVSPASGPVKFIGIGGMSAYKKKIGKPAPAAAVETAPSLSSEFKLGDAYVSPNPAKGGVPPVLHMETGIADSVSVKIYTVTGLLKHEHVITGVPQVLDKGGNLIYTYQYAWEGPVAGGIYYYTMEAEKAGQKLKKSGMFAVVR
jgi:hypothetical protein